MKTLYIILKDGTEYPVAFGFMTFEEESTLILFKHAYEGNMIEVSTKSVDHTLYRSV